MVKSRFYGHNQTLSRSQCLGVELADAAVGSDDEREREAVPVLVGVGRLVERGVGYNSKLDMTGLKDESGLELEPFDHFGPDELEARHKLLFKLVGIIWK